MSLEFVFVWMLFMHVFDDYVLQAPCLNKLKQKNWWRNDKNYTPFYEWDYVVALLCHSISWSFMIMLPLAVYYNFKVNGIFLSTFVVNTLWHSFMDNAKANEGEVNLVIDQLFHLLQIVTTFCFHGIMG